MTALPTIEGELSVGILVIDATVADVRLRSTRATGIGATLTGRPMGEALSLVPMLFSLCGIAQGIAAANACESATGITPSAAQRAAREILVLGEMADSHGWQIAMEWPRLGGGSPEHNLLLPLRKATSALAPALYPARDWTRPGGGTLLPDAETVSNARLRISAAIDRLIGSGFPKLRDVGELRAWALHNDNPAARFIARIIADDLASFGRSGVATLPDLTPDWFARHLAATPDFSRLPHIGGHPAETGAAHRIASTPLIGDLKQRYGNGLLSRFTAKLVELASLPARLAALSGYLSPEHPGETQADPTGSGAGIADTARGRLAHWISLDQGIVTDFRAVAPNEWNFHPQGAIVRGLVGLPACDDLRHHVDLLVAALDPCVPCRVMIEEHAGA
ncbi:MAG TPA: nickel-dependent hydrogenase large subunit [Skermanella sp.]|nr:nickel-dependent hydrogenase large subunit [Skermanella sp.]